MRRHCAGLYCLVYGPVAVTTLVDGTASMDAAAGIAFDTGGTMLFVADTTNHQIRSFFASTGAPASFVIGGIPGFASGNGRAARLNRPFGIAADLNGNLFVTEEGNHCITKIVIATQQTSLLAGDGTAGAVNGDGSNAKFSSPEGIAVRPRTETRFCSIRMPVFSCRSRLTLLCPQILISSAQHL
jgi:hypothetical protein